MRVCVCICAAFAPRLENVSIRSASNVTLVAATAAAAVWLVRVNV